MSDSAAIMFVSDHRVRLTFARPEDPGANLMVNVAAKFFGDDNALACDAAAFAADGWNPTWPVRLQILDTYLPLFDETTAAGPWPDITALIDKVKAKFPGSPIWYGASTCRTPVELTAERRGALNAKWDAHLESVQATLAVVGSDR